MAVLGRKFLSAVDVVVAAAAEEEDIAKAMVAAGQMPNMVCMLQKTYCLSMASSYSAGHGLPDGRCQERSSWTRMLTVVDLREGRLSSVLCFLYED